MSNWQQYDYDKDGYLESGKELQDYTAADQAETQQWLKEFHEDMEEVKEILTDIEVDLFWEATQNGAHYLMLAGEKLVDAAQIVLQAAQVIDWLGTAFRWLGYVFPVSNAVADALEKVEDLSEEKALKAHFVALGIVADGMLLASAGWTAKLNGRVTQAEYEQAYAVVQDAVSVGQGIVDVLFD